MKITNAGLQKTLSTQLEGTKSDKVSKSPKQGLGETSHADMKSAAKVNVSSQAQQMQKAKAIASEGLNDVDEAKVAHFQNLIDSGKYEVNADALAEKMVDEHLLMN